MVGQLFDRDRHTLRNARCLGRLRYPILIVAICCLIGFFGDANAGSAPLETTLLTETRGDDGGVQLIEVKDGDILHNGSRIKLRLYARRAVRVTVRYSEANGSTRNLVSSEQFDAGDIAYMPDRTHWLKIDGPDGTYSFEIIATGDAGSRSTRLAFTIISNEAFEFSEFESALPNVSVATSDITAAAPLQADIAQIKNIQNLWRTLRDVGKARDLSDVRASGVELYRENVPGVVIVSTIDGEIGTGSILSDTGLVLTNWHVIEDHDRVNVILKPRGADKIHPSHVYAATVVRLDEVADLALLKIEKPPTDLTVLKLGNMLDVAVGMEVHAIGHPLDRFWTYTRGIISQVRRDFSWAYTDEKKYHQATVIQTQTPINPGNSGGPLFTDEGQVIGVNSFVDQTGQGINFAVSLDDITNFLAREENRRASARPVFPDVFKLGSSAIAYDLNENGIADLWVEDRNHNGKLDTYLFDKDEDGVVDHVIIDENENEKTDVEISMISAPEGEIVLYQYDVNEDEKPDVLGFDYDLDGNPDRYNRTNLIQ